MDKYSLTQLADATGISARTIRYYIAEGLLPKPPQGPNAYYTPAHFDLLQKIKVAKERGLSLDQIKVEITKPEVAPVRPREPWVPPWKPQPAPVRPIPSWPPRPPIRRDKFPWLPDTPPPPWVKYAQGDGFVLLGPDKLSPMQQRVVDRVVGYLSALEDVDKEDDDVR